MSCTRKFLKRIRKIPPTLRSDLIPHVSKAWACLVRAGSISDGKGNQMNTLRHYLSSASMSKDGQGRRKKDRSKGEGRNQISRMSRIKKVKSIVNSMSVTRPKTFWKQKIRDLAHTHALLNAYLLFTRWRLMNGCKKAGFGILHCGHTREDVMGLFLKTHGRMTQRKSD